MCTQVLVPSEARGIPDLWMLGTEPGFSARAGHTLRHQATPPAGVLVPFFISLISSDFVFSLLPKTAPCTSHSKTCWDVVAKVHKVINK